MFSFVVPCTITFAELQYGLCQSIEAYTLKKVTNILYRSPVVVFGGLIQFEVMPIIDKTSIQWMFHIYQQTQVQHPRIELYVEFEHIATDEVQHDTDVQDDRVEAFLGMNNDSDGEFEATYITKPVIRTRTAIGETFYAKCKTYGRGCDWLIRASLIQKKACCEIRRSNGRHTCSMGTISQVHSKLDLDTITEAMKSLVESDPSIKVKSMTARLPMIRAVVLREIWVMIKKTAETLHKVVLVAGVDTVVATAVDTSMADAVDTGVAAAVAAGMHAKE
ncbi:hypothetical protein AHAS_Ahas06G0147200 [Arachis hypogaea]